jgi:hypothetical protein
MLDLLRSENVSLNEKSSKNTINNSLLEIPEFFV